MEKFMLDAPPNATIELAGTEVKLSRWCPPLNLNHSCSGHAVQDVNYYNYYYYRFTAIIQDNLR